MGISASGVGSGIPIQDIIDDLVAATRKKQDEIIKHDEKDVALHLSGYNSLKSMLMTFQSTLEGMSKMNGLYSMGQFVTFDCPVVNNVGMVPSSATPIATVTATDLSAVGSYTIDVDQLAQAQQFTTAFYPATNPDGSPYTIGTGSLNFTVGTDANGNPLVFNVGIDNTNNTVYGIAGAINSCPGNNNYVTANVLKVDAGYQLIITRTDTGTSNAMTIDVLDNDGDNTDMNGLSQLAYDTVAGVTNLTQSQPPQNASFRLNGQTVTSQSNTITNAISNATITLNAVSTVTVGGVPTSYPANVTISVNSGELTTQIQAFVDAYNELITGMHTLDFYNPATKEAGPLRDESIIYDIESQMINIINMQSQQPGAIQYFAMVGITINPDDTMAFDPSKLNGLIASNGPVSIASFFIGKVTALGADGLVQSTGMIPQLINSLTAFTKLSGTIDQAMGMLNDELMDIDTEKSRLNLEMKMMEERLKKQFGAMDAMVAKMKQTSSFISQQMATLPGFSSD